jgi:phosphate transport system protein
MTLESRGIGHHISREFNRELTELHAHVLEMGTLVSAQVRDAVRALVEGDTDLAAAVIARDPDVNAMELHIDQECNLVLVRRQPAAGDLRLVFAVIKAVIDLERVGDLAKRVATTVLETRGQERLASQIGHLGESVQHILATSLDAFSRLDVGTALTVRAEDKAIDAECKAVSRQVLTYMMEDARTISAGLALVWAARSLERMGDHAKNIAEYVFYAVLGKDLRHIGADEREAWIRANIAPQT